MADLISEIKKEMQKRRISEQGLADMAGTNQPKVHRTLSGKSKFVDVDTINKLADTLGIVQETAPEYSALPEPEQRVLDLMKANPERAWEIYALILERLAGKPGAKD